MGTRSFIPFHCLSHRQLCQRLKVSTRSRSMVVSRQPTNRCLLRLLVRCLSLNNLAFSLENCRFACAIEPKCVALEFAKDSFCNLLRKFDSSAMTRQLGTLTERKPPSCENAKVEEVGYPYALALQDLYDSLTT